MAHNGVAKQGFAVKPSTVEKCNKFRKLGSATALLSTLWLRLYDCLLKLMLSNNKGVSKTQTRGSYNYV